MSCLTSCARRAELRDPVQRSGSAIEKQQPLTRRRGGAEARRHRGTENVIAGLPRTRKRRKRRKLWELRWRTCSFHSFFCSLNNADSDDVALCNASTVSYRCRFFAAPRLRMRGVQLPSRRLTTLPFLGGTVAPYERCSVAVSSAPHSAVPRRHRGTV